MTMVAEGFSPLMKSVLTFCCLLGAVLGMTRQSHSEKMMPREMVAAVSQRGTPTLAWRQDTQSDQLLQHHQRYSITALQRYTRVMEINTSFLALAASAERASVQGARGEEEKRKIGDITAAFVFVYTIS